MEQDIAIAGPIDGPLHVIILWDRATPTDFVGKASPPKQTIQQRLQVVAGRRVTVEIEAAVGPQDAPHLDKPHSHEAKERGHIVAPSRPRRVDYFPDGRPVVLYLVDPLALHVVGHDQRS